jgi:hypothetical protein
LSSAPGIGANIAATAPANSIPLDVGNTTNRPFAESLPAPSIRLEPWLADNARAATWREQQLAKQAAEQKAREEERERLKSGLYRFLLNQDASRNP